MELSTQLGAVTFRLSAVSRAVMPDLEGRPFLRLTDGTMVNAVEVGARTFLVVDHRTEHRRPARVEFWACSSQPEVPLAGLLTLCDAVESRAESATAAPLPFLADILPA